MSSPATTSNQTDRARTEARHPLRVAVESRDLDALIDSFAPDVVLHSPLISATFEGRDEVGFVFRALAPEYLFRDDFHYTAELAEGDTVVLAFRGILRGQDVEGIDLLRLDAAGKIRDITVFLRPLPGATAVAQFLSPRIVGRGNRAKAAIVGLGVRPLSALSRLFDAIGSRQARARS
jgi:ketosteroid isomerase-like protein